MSIWKMSAGAVSGLFLTTVLLVAPLQTGFAAGAADKLNMGPAVGLEIPRSLTATDQDGQSRNFDTLKGEHGLILMFSRSLDW